jgi:hypothetical protein
MRIWVVYFIALALTIRAQAQTAAAYQASVNSQSPSYYFTLDNTLTDSVGGSLSLAAGGTGGGFANDYFGNATSSRFYSSSTDSLSTSTDILAGGGPTGGNAGATGVGSFSFLFRSLDAAPSGQRFLYAQGNTTGNANAFSLFFENTSNTDPGALKLRVGNGPTTTILLAPSVVADSWYYFAVTYDETRDAGEVLWYLGQAGGVTLSSGTINIGNVSVVGDNGTFTIGNSAVGASGAFRNPGNGQLDEVAIWNRELTSTEINSQYATLLAVPEPTGFALFTMGALLVGICRRRASAN